MDCAHAATGIFVTQLACVIGSERIEIKNDLICDPLGQICPTCTRATYTRGNGNVCVMERVIRKDYLADTKAAGSMPYFFSNLPKLRRSFPDRRAAAETLPCASAIARVR